MRVLDGTVGDSRPAIRVITLWNASHFAQGVSELDALQYLMQLGGRVRVFMTELHAKVYIRDGVTAIVTSANLTGGGLRRNVECGVTLAGTEAAAVAEQFEREWRLATEVSPADIDGAKEAVETRKDAIAKLRQELQIQDDELQRQLKPVQVLRLPDTDDLVIRLDPAQVDFLSRPIRGEGGYQSLLRRLQSHLSDGVLRLSADDCERIVRYTRDYGQGGWQDRLASIVAAAAQYVE